jgi:hypothetical protein
MDHHPCRRLVAATAMLLSIAPATGARADTPPTDAQLSVARDLFIAAEKDEDADRWADALDKLTRVAAVKLTSGIRYHTALCEEHLGRLLAALRDYKAAANQARAENASDVLRLVDKRLNDAADRLPRLVVVVVPSLPDATVLVDGAPIEPGGAVMVDPGSHRVEARAAGRVPAATTVSVLEHDSASIEVRLDPLAAPAPVPPPSPAPAAAAPTSTGTSEAPRDRALAIVGTLAAVALVGGGFGAYAMASRERSDAVASCALVASPQADACDGERNVVRAWDWVAVGAWTGAAVVGSLVAISLVRLGHDAGSSPKVVAGPASIALRGAF